MTMKMPTAPTIIAPYITLMRAEVFWGASDDDSSGWVAGVAGVTDCDAFWACGSGLGGPFQRFVTGFLSVRVLMLWAVRVAQHLGCA